jgi:hypothetical protein
MKHGLARRPGRDVGDYSSGQDALDQCRPFAGRKLGREHHVVARSIMQDRCAISCDELHVSLRSLEGAGPSRAGGTK